MERLSAQDVMKRKKLNVFYLPLSNAAPGYVSRAVMSIKNPFIIAITKKLLSKRKSIGLKKAQNGSALLAKEFIKSTANGMRLSSMELLLSNILKCLRSKTIAAPFVDVLKIRTVKSFMLTTVTPRKKFEACFAVSVTLVLAYLATHLIAFERLMSI